jgi:hypothetical protein
LVFKSKKIKFDKKKFYGLTRVQLKIEDIKKEDPWDSASDIEEQIPETSGLISNETTHEIQEEKNPVLAEEWFSRCVSSEHAIGSIILCIIWLFGKISENFLLAHSGAYLLNDVV